LGSIKQFLKEDYSKMSQASSEGENSFLAQKLYGISE